MHTREAKQGKKQSPDLQHDPFLLVSVDECVGNDFFFFLSPFTRSTHISRHTDPAEGRTDSR